MWTTLIGHIFCRNSYTVGTLLKTAETGHNGCHSYHILVGKYVCARYVQIRATQLSGQPHRMNGMGREGDGSVIVRHSGKEGINS